MCVCVCVTAYPATSFKQETKQLLTTAIPSRQFPHSSYFLLLISVAGLDQHIHQISHHIFSNLSSSLLFLLLCFRLCK